MKTVRSLITAAATCLAVGTAAVAALTVPTRPVAAEAPPSNSTPSNLIQVKALFGEKCSACHKLPKPEEKGYTKAEWQRTVTQMLTKYHASDSIAPIEAAQIVSYLGTFLPKTDARRPGGRLSDPWATDALDVWTDAPALTRVFNFSSLSPLSALSSVGSGTPGPAPSWLVSTDKAGADGMVARVSAPAFRPDRFALLIDRADQGRNLDVRVRFRIESGKTSPAVGIAFGLTDPSHYAVLRCNQALGDLALIQIAGATHTNLQQTSLKLPPAAPALPILATTGIAPPPQTPAVPTPLAPGWHTLRLLVKDGQVRGWLDMQKRINVRLSGYGGGKVALWTQGSTTAAFHDWIVDWYDAPLTAPLS